MQGQTRSSSGMQAQLLSQVCGLWIYWQKETLDIRANECEPRKWGIKVQRVREGEDT